MQRAKLKGADLEGANLRSCVGLTQDQVALAYIDGSTVLPDYLATKVVDIQNKRAVFSNHQN